MELLNAIKSLGAFAVYLFNQWLGWAWYIEIITGLISLLLIIFVIAVFIESILIAYTKPTMLNDKETHILGMFASKKNMEKNKDYGTPRNMSIVFSSCLIAFLLATYYLFWIPWLSIKIAIAIALIGSIIYYFKIVYYYGYTILPLIFMMTLLTHVLSILNFNFGLPDFPPHYIFDWWGLGINSTSNSFHILPFPNITVNATDYTINFNQYYYLALLLISYYGILLNICNYFKWQNKTYDPAIKTTTGSSIEFLDQVDQKVSEQGDTQISSKLKLIGFSDDSISIITSKYSDLMISEILHDMNRENPDNQKKYIISRL
ncbi:MULTISPECIES: hypothetical protein [Cysteiniphilum]|uniref:hypothetical protein n=1 Tax=Cysteiniphilum TaxID=2056696 RepID=UPI001780F67A|nr:MULTISPECIES: hypothetical protein [Cysteiniphilum]